jgi:hypothetical protein
MAEIAIDFLWGTGWTSKLIGQFGFPQGPSHCASVIKDVRNGEPRERYLDSRNNVIAGVPAGVHIREIASETFIKKQRATLQVSQAEYDYWETGLRAHMTTKYDELAILGFLEGKSLHTAGRWICSALSINGVQHLSRTWVPGHLGYIPFPLRIPAHEISPDTGLLILETAGFSIGATLTDVQKEFT